MTSARQQEVRYCLHGKKNRRAVLVPFLQGSYFFACPRLREILQKCLEGARNKNPPPAFASGGGIYSKKSGSVIFLTVAAAMADAARVTPAVTGARMTVRQSGTTDHCTGNAADNRARRTSDYRARAGANRGTRPDTFLRIRGNRHRSHRRQSSANTHQYNLAHSQVPLCFALPRRRGGDTKGSVLIYRLTAALRDGHAAAARSWRADRQGGRPARLLLHQADRRLRRHAPLSQNPRRRRRDPAPARPYPPPR